MQNVRGTFAVAVHLQVPCRLLVRNLHQVRQVK